MRFIKDYFLTIVLILVILGVIGGVAFFLFNDNSKYESNEIDISETSTESTKAEEKDETDEVIDEQEETEEDVLNNNHYEIEGQEENVYVEYLGQIAEAFNNCGVTQRMIEQGYSMNALVFQDKLRVVTSKDDLHINVDFSLDNNILYAKIFYSETSPFINMTEELMAILVADSVGQVKGYPDGAISGILLSDDEALSSYTVENEGVEIKIAENGLDVIVRIDLDSDFPFVEM